MRMRTRVCASALMAAVSVPMAAGVASAGSLGSTGTTSPAPSVGSVVDSVQVTTGSIIDSYETQDSIVATAQLLRALQRVAQQDEIPLGSLSVPLR